jgi:hypothetical protein
MPKQGTRAYLVQRLQAYVTRAWRDTHREWPYDFKKLDKLLKILPPGRQIVVRFRQPVGRVRAFHYAHLDLTGVETEEIAKAVARIGPTGRGRPKGTREPFGKPELLSSIDRAVESGMDSIRTAAERVGKRAGVSPETLRKQYRRYRKPGGIPF